MNKIMYMLNYVGNGGTENYVFHLMNAIGPENCVLVYSEDGPGIDRFKSLNIKMYQVHMNHPFDIKAAKAIKTIIRNEKIDIVHAQFLRENYIAILAKLIGARIKVIWTYHVDVPMNSTLQLLNRMMTSYNKAVITVSKFMENQITNKGVSKKVVKLIYNGIQQPSIQRNDTTSKIPVLSVIGRFTEEKGHAFLLESLAYIQREHPELEWQCNLFGEGPLMEELKNSSRELGMDERVHFKGHVSNKDEMYVNTDIVVLPSNNDALPYVGIEAIAYGIPVIGTNVGGIPEIVVDGETGYIVNYGDTKQLAEKIVFLIQNHDIYKMFSENGKRHFNKLFTETNMIDKTIHVYNS
ncbi:glycosyltransferase family 1 protein [Bacillus sp. HNG]|uniref:glycosyltransferase n=1 Tax=Bacillus sp. HNG TaxID=2293325 RepID=UPI000E2FEF12|nr:glycosyltransferase [Bacillus sp. HNG]RFB11055.1 glycosyltransferase family 1 protein [Bacillus sp. HNG]